MNGSLHTAKKKTFIFLLNSNVLCIVRFSFAKCFTFAHFQYIKDNFGLGALEEKYYTLIETKLVSWL